jgi:two-component system, LuxR family, sensor kinase FixL
MNDAQNIARLQAIIDHAIDGIITINEEGIIETVNPAAEKIFEYKASELIGQKINMLMPEPDRSRHDKYMQAYRDTGIKKIIGIGREVTGRKKSGKLFPFQLGVSEIKLGGKTIYSGIIHDLSQVKAAEIALKESQNRIQAIFDTAVDGIITINERGIIQSVNPSAATIFGYSEEELIGNTINMLMPEPYSSQHDQYMENYHRTGERKIIGIGRVVEGLKKDGTTFPFYLSVGEVFVGGQRLYTGFVHDITEQKRNEEKLKRYAADLERSNQELQNFAYVSSHDLQEPLRKIQAFGDRLKTKERENLSEQGKDYIDRMLNAAVRMQNLINDLLTFSRVTSKARPFEKVDLNQVLQGVISDLEISIEKNKATIEVDTLPVIEADNTQMRQLFQNLISNGIKFRKENVNPHIKISYKKFQVQSEKPGTSPDNFIELYFEDNGIGFDEKYLDRIFNIFQRLEGQKYEGSGIGLSICRKIAIRHGGHITAKSKSGEGTTFIVKLALSQHNDPKKS